MKSTGSPVHPETDIGTGRLLANPASPHPVNQVQPAVQAVLETVPSKTDGIGANLPLARPHRTTAPLPSLVRELSGFERNCRVATSIGDMPIEALRPHDRVRTLSGAFLTVRSIDCIHVDAEFMAHHPQAQPMEIRAAALGPRRPSRNMLLAPGQIMSTGGDPMQTGTVAVAELEGRPGIWRAPKPEMTYYRFCCDEPATVCIDGAWFGLIP